jgi:hypothetical protein
MTILNPVTIVNSDTSPINVVLANVSELVNAQVGTTYTVLSTDWGKLVTFSNGSAIAVTLPEAGSAGFSSGWNANFVNLGAGTVTITPTTSTINGAATLTPTTIAGGTFSTMYRIPVATVAATGADQAGAAPIATGFTLATAGDGTNGVRLPAAATGLQCIIKNDAALGVNVYPASGDAINAIIADSPLVMAALTSATLTSYDGTTWYTTPLLPS